MKEEFEDYYSDSIFKFESMLKTNDFLFFDSDEFEEIIVYYLEIGNVSLAKKAISMATEQYPNSVTLVLLQIELLLFNNELDESEKLIEKLSILICSPRRRDNEKSETAVFTVSVRTCNTSNVPAD